MTDDHPADQRVAVLALARQIPFLTDESITVDIPFQQDAYDEIR